LEIIMECSCPVEGFCYCGGDWLREEDLVDGAALGRELVRKLNQRTPRVRLGKALTETEAKHARELVEAGAFDASMAAAAARLTHGSNTFRPYPRSTQPPRSRPGTVKDVPPGPYGGANEGQGIKLANYDPSTEYGRLAQEQFQHHLDPADQHSSPFLSDWTHLSPEDRRAAAETHIWDEEAADVAGEHYEDPTLFYPQGPGSGRGPDGMTRELREAAVGDPVLGGEGGGPAWEAAHGDGPDPDIGMCPDCGGDLDSAGECPSCDRGPDATRVDGRRWDGSFDVAAALAPSPFGR
jgi:hypothetical protein